jgi:cyclic beta-1,2-glucan synthetase
MSLDTPKPGSSRETDVKQIDHNDSIRATYLTIEDLRDCGVRLGRGEGEELPGLMSFEFFQQHSDNEKEILRVYRAAALDVDAGASITPAAEWLLDNYYIVEEAIQEVRRDFPKKFFKQLPTRVIQGQKMPRVLALAWLYVAHTHSGVNRETLAAMVEGFQENEPLEIGELWALPSFIRFVLIENLRRIATRVDRSRNMRKRANDVADEIIRLNDETESAKVLAGVADLVRDNTFAAQFLYRMRNASQSTTFATQWIEQRLAEVGTDVETVTQSEQSRLSSGNVTMGNIIKSLRLIIDTEWSVWFEDVSQIDKLFREHTDYEALDFGSRNAYRNRIEKLARLSKRSEAEVTQAAIKLSQEAAEKDPDVRETNVGAFIVGRHRKELEAAVGYNPPILQQAVRAYRKLNWLAIAAPVILLTVLAMVLTGYFLVQAAIPLLVVFFLLLMFALPASEGATGLFNTVVTYFVKPARLVGYEFKEGIPEEAKTLVVVPCLITDRDTVDELVRNLEVHYLANPHGEIYFSLLSDWRDAKTEQTEADLEILDYA